MIPQVQQVWFQHRQKVLELCFWQNAAQARGALHSCEHVQPCVHTNTHKRVFLKSCPAELTGLWCLLEEKSCGFSPSSLSLCPTLSDDLHFILLYFLWFIFAASNYSFSFGKHYHPVLLHSRFPFILFRTIRPFTLLSLPWSLLLHALRVRRGVRRLCCVRDSSMGLQLVSCTTHLGKVSAEAWQQS